MEVEILMTKLFEQAFRKYQHREIVQDKIQKLIQNPYHPSLKAHPLRRARRGIWECYVSGGDRMIYEVKQNQLILWYLGSHAVIDRVHQRNFDQDKTLIPFNASSMKPPVPTVDDADLKPDVEQQNDILKIEAYDNTYDADQLLETPSIEESSEGSSESGLDAFAFILIELFWRIWKGIGVGRLKH